MKHFWLLSLTLLSVKAQALSVVPERVVTPPLNIFHSSNKEVEPGQISVKVTSVNKRGGFVHGKERLSIDAETFASYQKLASPVYQMIPDPYYGADEDNEGRRGTAFHIGYNLVLTNAHVLSKKFTNTTHCGDFELKLNHSNDSVDCKKVHYCSVAHDVCLIEMDTHTRGWGRNERFISLAQGPALKLRAHWDVTVDEMQDIVLTAIGNSAGYGIHFSQGKGMSKRPMMLYFWAPITGGNSGGALLDSEGLVVGVVRAESKTKISQDPYQVYNVATSSETVIGLIRSALRNDPETLEKFNRSVVE